MNIFFTKFLLLAKHHSEQRFIKSVGRESEAHPALTLVPKLYLGTKMVDKLSLAGKCVPKLSLGTRRIYEEG